MRFTISTSTKRLMVEIPEDKADSLFLELANTLLGNPKRVLAVMPALKGIERQEDSIRLDAKSLATQVQKEILTQPVPLAEEKLQQGHKGFLYVRCPECRGEVGFCVKTPITSAVCKLCGHKHTLPDKMTVASFRCECGARFKYLTNITDPAFDIPCLDCKAPKALVYHAKNDEYRGV